MKRSMTALAACLSVAGLLPAWAAAADTDASAAPDESSAPVVGATAIDWLFVQNAAGGSLAAADDGSYELVLEAIDEATIAFSDTPYQIVVPMSTSDVVDVINTATNKPNAALQLMSPDPTTVILTLTSGVFDETTGSLTWEAELLADGSLGEILPEGDVPGGDFSAPTLFIDGETVGTESPAATFEVGSTCETTEAQTKHCWALDKGSLEWPIKVTFKNVSSTAVDADIGIGWFCDKAFQKFAQGTEHTITFHHKGDLQLQCVQTEFPSPSNEDTKVTVEITAIEGGS